MQTESDAKLLGLTKVAHLEISLCDKPAVLGKARGAEQAERTGLRTAIWAQGGIHGEASDDILVRENEACPKRIISSKVTVT